MSLCHDGHAPDSLLGLCGPPPPLPPPFERPASPESAAIEAELRSLFDQIAMSGGLAFRLCSGALPGSEYIECSDTLSRWVCKFFKERGGDDGSRERIEKLVYKLLKENITKLHQDDGISYLSGGRELMDASVDSASLRRKSETLSDMLMWLKGVAADPCDPRTSGTVQEWRQWRNLNLGSQSALILRSTNSLNVDEIPYEDKIMYWRKMVLSAREALFLRSTDDLSTEEFPYRLQKKQKIHRFLCETPRAAATLSSENMGQTGLPCFFACSVPSLLNQNYSVGSSFPTRGILNQPKRRSQRSLGLLKFSDLPRKRVPIGPFFQVDVPEWTGPPSKGLLSGVVENLSDSRWLGTQIWPIGGSYQETGFEVIGKKRLDLCSCPSPRSVDCVRYHVSISRFQLKYELGQAFYSLGFNDMGEEVAKLWTWEEQMIFDTLVRLNPVSEGKSFWEPALKFFASKNRQSIASYYFNVFVLKRMSIQTRLAAGNADSDDDEINAKAHVDLYPRASQRRHSRRKP